MGAPNERPHAAPYSGYGRHGRADNPDRPGRARLYRHVDTHPRVVGLAIHLGQRVVVAPGLLRSTCSMSTLRRKELYLLKHPETAHVSVRGGPGRGKKTGAT